MFACSSVHTLVSQFVCFLFLIQKLFFFYKPTHLLSHFSASSLWLTDMLCGTWLHLWPFPITMEITTNLQLASSEKIKSIRCFPESSVGLQKKESGAKKLWFPYWYSANWAHFYSSTLAGLSGPFIPYSLVDLFGPSNVFVPLLPRHWDRGFVAQTFVTGPVGSL